METRYLTIDNYANKVKIYRKTSRNKSLLSGLTGRLKWRYLYIAEI
jgi:hypothetical protein